MKSNIFFYMLLSMFFIFIIQGCNPTGIVGIDESITIDGIEFSVSSVVRKNEYSAGGQVSKPKSSADIILVVQADLSAGNEEVNPHEWSFSVVDENGRIDKPDISNFMSGIIDGESRNVLELIFGVDKNSDSFTLILLDNEIVLDSLISEN